MFNCIRSSILTNSLEIFAAYAYRVFVLLQIYFYFLIFEKFNSKVGKLSPRKENFIPGLFIVLGWTWPGRGTFHSVPGLSRAIRDIWSPYVLHNIHMLLIALLCIRLCKVVSESLSGGPNGCLGPSHVASVGSMGKSMISDSKGKVIIHIAINFPNKYMITRKNESKIISYVCKYADRQTYILLYLY